MAFPFTPRGGLPFSLRQGAQENNGQPAPQLRSPLIFNAPIAGRISTPDYIPNILIGLLALAVVPVGMQRAESAPAIKAPVVADQFVNNVLFGIPANLPKGSQLYASAPAIKAPVVADQFINNSAGIPAGTAPGHTQQSDSAPPLKYSVVADQFVNNLLLGINAQTAFVQIPGIQSVNTEIQRNAPEIKYQLRIDPIPNLIGKTLIQSTTRPFAGLVEPDLPTIKPYTTADMYVVTYIPTTVAAITTRPALLMPVPTRKLQVFAEQQPNTLIRGIPAVATTKPFVVQQDTSQLQPKSNVYDLSSEFYNELLPAGFPPTPTTPFITNVFYNRIGSIDVIDHSFLADVGRIIRGIPPPVVPPTPPGTGQGTTIPGGRVILNPKKAGETIPEPFNFLSSLSPGEVIVSAFTACSVYTGVDPNASSMILGGTSVNSPVCTQEVTGGVVGVMYELLCTALTNFQNIIEQSAFLAIEPDLPG
jgi:hypothetical protein